MIEKPQIFVIYLPGMFGTLIANILMNHELLIDYQVEGREFDAAVDYNLHKGPYRDFIENLHSNEIDLFKKNTEQLEKFFSPMENIPLGVHRLADYRISTFDFEKIFKKTLRIILIPENKDDLKIWGERWFYASGNDVTKDFWYPQFKKKGIKNLPKELIEGLGIKERFKYATHHYNEMVQNNIKKLENKNCIFFDPKHIANLEKIQNLMDEICDNLEISKFAVPSDKINRFLRKNDIFLKKFDSLNS